MNIRNPTTHVLFLLLLSMFLIACTRAPRTSPALSPEEQAQAEQRRLEYNKQRKKDRFAEAKKRGLLSLTDEQKVQFVEEFLSKLRAKNTGCDSLIDIGYYDPNWYGVRCLNGTVFPVAVSGDELFAMSPLKAGKFYGTDVRQSVWFIHPLSGQSEQ